MEYTVDMYLHRFLKDRKSSSVPYFGYRYLQLALYKQKHQVSVRQIARIEFSIVSKDCEMCLLAINLKHPNIYKA